MSREGRGGGVDEAVYEREEFADLQNRYLTGEYREFLKEGNFGYLTSFFWEKTRGKKIEEMFLIRSAVLIGTVTERESVRLDKISMLTGSYLSWYQRYLVESAETEMTKRGMDIVMRSYLKKRDEVERERKLYSTNIHSSDVVKNLCMVVMSKEDETAAEKHLVRMISGNHVSDRRTAVATLRFPADGSQRGRIMGKMFDEADADETIDLSHAVDGYACGRWVTRLPEEEKARYWRSFTNYCKRREEAGYSNEVIFDDLYDSVLEIEGESLPEELREMLEREYLGVEEVGMERFDVERLWEVLCGNKNWSRTIEDFREKVGYANRLDFLEKNLPGESYETVNFLAQLLTSDLSRAFDDQDKWKEFYSSFEVKNKKLLESPAIKKVWSEMKKNQTAFGYQMAFWLAFFPTKTLAGLKMGQMDVVENADLMASSVSLCGMAEIYMQESLNSDNIVVIEGGKLLFKRSGNQAALCTEDFKVRNSRGEEKVFKRGCFYTPVMMADYFNTRPMSERPLREVWQFDRSIREESVPIETKDLMHLADRWKKKHGYASVIK